MKNFFLLMFLVPMLVMSQAPVRTEDASNRYKNYSAATTGDTIFVSASSIAVGSSIPNYNTAGYLVGLLIGLPVSKDTIQIKNGLGTVFYTILDSTYTGEPNVRYTTPIYIPLHTRLDTSLIYIQTKTSNVTLFYRLKY